MRALFFSVVFCLGWVVAAQAQQSEIEGTISGQIEAFRADDFETAFTFATPRLRDLFQTPENFRTMVTQGYPMVWRPAELRFLDLRGEGGTYWQTVMVTDAQGVYHLLEYLMQETPDGWRIGGVRILDQGTSSA